MFRFQRYRTQGAIAILCYVQKEYNQSLNLRGFKIEPGNLMCGGTATIEDRSVFLFPVFHVIPFVYNLVPWFNLKSYMAIKSVESIKLAVQRIDFY